MARKTARPRRPISHRQAQLLKLVGFRYSASRDAYILRIAGSRVGPVFQIRQSSTEPTTLVHGAGRRDA